MSDMRNGDVLCTNDGYFLVTEIPEEALPVPEFEVGQEVELLVDLDTGPCMVIGPPLWWKGGWRVPVHRSAQVPTCEPADFLRPIPSTVTKTIRVTGSEEGVADALKHWANCQPDGVTVEVEEG